MAAAYYTTILPREMTSEILNYAKEITHFQPVVQYHEGNLYHSVSSHYVPTGHPIERHIVGAMVSTNRAYYHYDLYGTFEVQLLKYTSGGHYNWHCDYDDTRKPYGVRKISMSMQLSDPNDYTGGELELVDWGNRKITMGKDVGTVMIFDSRVPHKVTPIIEGVRYAIVSWAHGPALR
jgi:PKHD-type hydroxylase